MSPSRRSKPGGSNFPLLIRPIDAIDRHVEDRTDHGIEDVGRCHLVCARKSCRFGHGLEYACHHQVAGDLGDVRIARLRPEPPGFPAHGVKQRLHPLDRLRVARCQYVEIALGRHLRPAEHRRGYVGDAIGSVRRRQLVGARDRSRRYVDVDRGTAAKDGLVEKGRAHGVVVRQHRDHGFAAKRILRTGRGLRTGLPHLVQSVGRRIPGAHAMAACEQIAHHHTAHSPHTDESDVHDASPDDRFALSGIIVRRCCACNTPRHCTATRGPPGTRPQIHLPLVSRAENATADRR